MNGLQTRGTRRFLLLSLIMTVVAGAIGGIAIAILYDTAYHQERRRLVGLAHRQSGLILSIDRLERETGRGPVEARAEALRHARAAEEAARGIAAAGEGKIEAPPGHAVVMVLDFASAEATADSGSTDAPGAALRLAALSGSSGVYVGPDHRGVRVMAAYEPVPDLDITVVASIDMAALTAPFARAGTAVAAIALLLITAGSLLFSAVSEPIVRRIRDSEARFRELFENMKNGLVIYQAAGDADRSLIVKDLNRAAERIYAVSRDRVIGRPITEAFSGATASPVLDALKRVVGTGEPEILPAWFYVDDRTSGWRENYIFRLPTGDVVSAFDDVTEKIKADQELRENEALWRSVIEMQAIATIIVDKNNDIRFANRAAEALFGHPAKNLVGAPFGVPIVEGDVAEIELIRASGGVAYAEMQSIPIRWHGEQQHLLFLRDMSAVRRAEGDLRKLFQAIEQSPASVVITDVEGRIEYVNPKFTEATGYTYPEVVGKNPRILKSGATPPEDYAALWKTIRAGKVWRGEFRNRKKSGELFWELAAIAPVRDARGDVTHYVAVKEDITDRKLNEERLRQAEKMHAIGELTGGIAHDFNNLLAIILGNLQLLEEVERDKDKRELIADSIWSAERGAELTSHLLAFARRQRLDPRVTDLNHVVHGMTDLLRRTLGERIEIREALCEGAWKIKVDQGQLENALLNLVVNARDAMPDGGVLTIETGNAVRTAAEEQGPETVAAGDYAMIAVRDTGSGMPPEVVERIFEPFFTTKKFGKGSGLGLSMVYGFVNQSGGQVTVESAVGEGTTVRLCLPRAAADESEAVAEAPTRRVPGGGGEVILVVEDDARVRRTVTRALRKEGYRVEEAAGSAEALRRMDRLTRLDLLFTDVVLGDSMNGYELAKRILDLRPRTRVLLTSGYAEEAAGPSAPSPPEFALVPKPYRLEILLRRIREALDRTEA